MNLTCSLSESKLKNLTFKRHMNLTNWFINDYTILNSIFSENDQVMIINGSAFLCPHKDMPWHLLKSPVRSYIEITNDIIKVLPYAFHGHANSLIAFHNEGILFDYNALDGTENISLALPSLDFGFNENPKKKITNLYITSNSNNPPKQYDGPNVENYYYCGTYLLNTTIDDNQDANKKHTLRNYSYEYFLGTKNFSKDLDPEICAKPPKIVIDEIIPPKKKTFTYIQKMHKFICFLSIQRI